MSILVELFAVAPLSPAALRGHRLDVSTILDGAPGVDLGHSWQATERVFAGCDPIWNGAFEGGVAIDGEIRYLPPELVARLGATLDSLDPTTLSASVARLLAAPGDLYGGGWSPRDQAALIALCERVLSFWRDASSRGCAAVVIWG